MESAREPFSSDPIRLGPFKIVEIHTPPADDTTVSEAIDTRTVSFEEVKHLIAKRPLLRAPAPEA